MADVPIGQWGYQSDRIVPRNKPIYRTPPVWEGMERIGATAKYDTRVKIYIQRATFEFPKVAIKFGVHNGRGSIFSTVTIDELLTLADFINNSVDSIRAAIETNHLMEEEKHILEAQQTVMQQQAQLQQLAQALGQDHD